MGLWTKALSLLNNRFASVPAAADAALPNETVPGSGETGTRATPEDRMRYLYLLVGFGFLCTGIWVGIQFLVDGLNAGYPFLTLIGAGIVLAGVGIDLGLHLFFPRGNGRQRMTLQLGKWQIRLCGLNAADVERFVAAVATQWKKPA